jgi:signal transduction histidine kinase
MLADDRVNILMVDDQPAKLMTYEAVLKPLGENLIQATSAREALEYLLKYEIGVILIDVVMPELDGFELASMIRQHPRFRQTAIIFVSAVHMTDFDRLRGFECGAVDYVSVPVVPELLLARVAVFVELHRKTRQLEAMNHNLEALVEERTGELEASTAALLEREERLQQTDRRKDEFLALIGHELRNPLASIRNAAKILWQEHASDRDRQWGREVIDRQVDHLARLVDDLLDVSRITSGKLQLRREPAEISSILAAAVEATQPLIEASGHELTVAVPHEPVRIFGDVMRLTQVLANLLNNAAKFTPRGGHIALSAESNGGYVFLRVKDDGIGIPLEDQERLFQMFYQSPRPSVSEETGLGIGLTLVRQLVELHGGSVKAASTGAGQGSEFTVQLPLPEESELRAAPVKNAPQDGRVIPVRRVLVADDNRDAAESLALLLQLRGHQVQTVFDGQAAVAIAERGEIDVALLDIAMPLMNGYEVAKRIREMPNGKGLVLIALTGWGQTEARTRTREAGFDHHLTKPVDFAQLEDLLARTAGDLEPV